MTVANTDYFNSLTGNGSNKVFAFSFRCVDDAHVQVYLNGVQQVSGFKVLRDSSGVGGTVTFTTAPANGVNVLLVRISDSLQNDSLGANEAFNPKVLEDMIDKLTIIAQQFNLQFAQALRFANSVNLQDVSAELPSPESGLLLGWNLEATALRNVSPAQAFADLVEGGAGSGDVFGPSSSANGEVALFAATNGKSIKRGPAPGALNNVLKSDGTNWVSGAVPVTAAPVPSGTLALFFNAAHVPAHWAICNGQTVTINGGSFTTPDCRGKYLIGASLDDTGSAGYTGAGVVAGAVGGAKTHNHTQQGTLATTSNSTGGSILAGTSGGQIAVKNTTTNHSHNVTLSGNTVDNTEASRPLSVAAIVAIKVDE